MWYTGSMSHVVEMGDRGRLVIPAQARKELGLKKGSRVVLTIEGPGVLKLTTNRQAAASCLGLLQELAAGRSLADELIAERREAARSE